VLKRVGFAQSVDSETGAIFIKFVRVESSALGKKNLFISAGMAL